MNVARTTYRAALVAAALSCLGYASMAHADRDDWRGDRRWTEERGPDRDDRRPGGRWDDRRWNGPRHGGYEGWRWAPPPRYWRPPPVYYYAPPPRYYRPWPGYYAEPRPYGGWRGRGYYDSRGRWCDDGDVSLTIRIPF
jgi:hypothetical protein